MLHKVENQPAEHNGCAQRLQVAGGGGLPLESLLKFKILVVREKVSGLYLCWNIFLSKPYVETIHFKRRDSGNFKVDLSEQERTEYTEGGVLAQSPYSFYFSEGDTVLLSWAHCS